MSEMDAFFKRYYVGCNMGIILAGDIDPAATLPILERTFGRIERGTPPERQLSSLPPIHGQQELTVRIPIPVVSARGLLFRAPTDYEADANALDIGLQLLSNGSSGLLDSLMNESKLLGALSMRMALNDAGVAGYLVVPNLLGSTKKAVASVQEQVLRLQRGDFSDAQFEAAKLDAIRKAENIEPSEADIEKATADQAERSGMDVEEFKKNLTEEQKSYLKDNAAIQKVLDLLKDGATILEKKEEKDGEAEKPAKKPARKTAKKDAENEEEPAKKPARKTAKKEAADGDEAEKPVKKAAEKKAAKAEDTAEKKPAKKTAAKKKETAEE
jgi:secreted Zn-dependent insulinase-like peptidase